MEYLNPGGSIKDRSALFMVEDAERRGELKAGGTIIEASSGNQGIALAMIGAAKGYEVIITVPQHTSPEKVAALRAYGADVHVCPDTPTLQHPDSYHSVAERILESKPGAFMPNQYFNAKNPSAHYLTTGPEIWEQTEGKVTHFFCAMGSCGTVSGVGQFLKEQNPEIQIIGADSAHSLLSSKNPQAYEVEGIGVDVISDTLKREFIDQIVPVYDYQAFRTLKKYAERGMLLGPSCGAMLFVVEQFLDALTEDSLAVCILADSGRAYLSKLSRPELLDDQREFKLNEQSPTPLAAAG